MARGTYKQNTKTADTIAALVVLSLLKLLFGGKKK